MPRPPRVVLPTATALACLLLTGCQSTSSRSTPADTTVHRNLGAELSEDPTTDRALDAALAALLAQAERGTFEADLVAPDHLAQHEFFFKGLAATRRSRNPATVIAPAAVLKSYSFDSRNHYITLAYHGHRDGERFLRKIVQIKAVPHAGGYRFECLLEERTANLATTQVDNVTFRHAHPIEASEAERFTEFRRMFCGRTGVPCKPLTYYTFASLEQMLHAHGIEFDCNKCNFLSNDLGFGDAGGDRFVTGMARECNIRDYIYAHFEFCSPDPEQMFRAVKEGIAVCYGNTWGGVTLPQMNAKFRRRLREVPDTDFLTEFRKGRKASVDSHFTHYYLCALLCNELIANDRLDGALDLLYTGPNGERFFPTLHRLLAIDESNFHDSVVRLMHLG
ncbi:MAG: hypothetical protein NXI31_21020 [bacterium]|nr:hypothetical protein [bacterium]